jgi:hypothetical protein
MLYTHPVSFESNYSKYWVHQNPLIGKLHSVILTAVNRKIRKIWTSTVMFTAHRSSPSDSDRTILLPSNIGCQILTRTLLPWLPVHEMCDMEMINTFTVCVCKRDNCRNRSPGKFGEQKWHHRTKSVKIMEVEQRYVINFFSYEGVPGVQIVKPLK